MARVLRLRRPSLSSDTIDARPQSYRPTPTRRTTGVRPALVGLAVLGLVACGSREPTTDAERLARGRELVQQMSDAARRGDRSERDDDRSAGRRACLRHEGAGVADRCVHHATPGSLLRQDDGRPGPRDLVRRQDADRRRRTRRRSSRRRRCPRRSTARWTRLPSGTTWPLPMGDLFYGSAEKALLSDTTTGGYVGTENVGDTPCVHLAFQGRRRRLGAVASGAGRPAAEAAEGRAETAHGPAGGRSDVHGLGSRAANQRCHVRPEGAGGLRGHRHPAARRGGQERGGRDAAAPRRAE